MGHSLARAGLRTEAKTLRTGLDDIRAGSHMVRMTANPSLGREAFKEVKTSLGRSQKELAIGAGVAESVFSEALNGTGRNFDIDWVLSQDNTFLVAWWRYVETAKALTPAAKKRIRVERMAQLLDLLTQHDEEVA